jgi:hypothetical protein
VNETVVFSQAAVESKLTVVNDARQYLETLAVTDQPSAQVAADFLGDLQDELKSIEEMKQSALKPLRASEQTIRGWFKPLEAALGETIALVKSKLGKYELDARDAQRAAFAEASKHHAAGEHIEARAKIEESNELATKRKAKGASAREVWEAQIADAGAIPREWCVPDVKRIEAMARATPAASEPTPIPGVTFARKVVVVGRPRKKD